MSKDYIAIDVETTGLNPQYHRLIEIAAIKVNDFEIVDSFVTLINPEINIPQKITEITGITDMLVEESPTIKDVMKQLVAFCEDYILIGHNLLFDYSFIKQNCMADKHDFEKEGIDTLKIARKMLPELEKRNLGYLCKHLDISQDNYHRAYQDAYATSALYQVFYHRYHSTQKELFRPTQLQYQAKKMAPITNRQKLYLNNLLKHHKINTDVMIEHLSKNEASKMIDKIILQYGRIF